MFDALTWDEWSEHLQAFTQDPDDERRKDDRNAVNALWSLAPYIGEGDLELPGFEGPGYANSKTDDIDASIERVNALKKKLLNGQLNRKTSNPAND